MHLLEDMLSLQEDQKLKTVALLWCWWTERNKSNRGDRYLTVEEFKSKLEDICAV
jgi:hypothetical protein